VRKIPALKTAQLKAHNAIVAVILIVAEAGVINRTIGYAK
jgi:hypothetical protein